MEKEHFDAYKATQVVKKKAVKKKKRQKALGGLSVKRHGTMGTADASQAQ